jgi:uncharacterized membrane protein
MTTPVAYPEQSQATTILILGIVGLLCCGPLGIVSWIMGNKELKAIEEGRRNPAQRSTANAGRVIGIVAVVLWVLAAILSFVGFLTIFPFQAERGFGS